MKCYFFGGEQCGGGETESKGTDIFKVKNGAGGMEGEDVSIYGYGFDDYGGWNFVDADFFGVYDGYLFIVHKPQLTLRGFEGGVTGERVIEFGVF